MGALPIPEPTGIRYAPYIQELREFFAFSGLKYGSPDDVYAVIEHIQTSPSFAEDLSSLVRAAILREGGSMPQGQLLEILAIAVGGTEMEHAPQTHRQPLRQLLTFIAGVLRRPWNLPPGERLEVLSFPSEPQPPADAPSSAATPATNPGAPFVTASPSRVGEAVPIAAVPPALAPLAATAFAGPEPPQPQPVPRHVLRDAFALKPILATDLPPAPPKPKPQPPPPTPTPTLEVRFESPLDSPPNPVPDPLPHAARSPEPVPRPEFTAARQTADHAEHRSTTSAPWVASHRPPKSQHSQVEKADSSAEKTPASLVDSPAAPPAEPPAATPAWRKRIPRLSRSMHEVVTAGACAVVIAVLVAVALRPGSSLQSETLPASSPNPSPNPSSNPVPVPTPIPQATEPAKPTADGPVLALPPGAARKSHSGAEYIAPPTVHYYNGWGPAGSQPAANRPGEHPLPASGKSVATASAPASPSAAGSAGSAEGSPSAAPIERRSGVSSFKAHTDDIGGQHYFAVPSSTMAGNLVSAPKPDYPLLARLAHVEGEVVVEAVIDRDGAVSATHVVSGPRLLRGAAVSALRRRRYRPYRVDGRPVDVATTFAVNVTARK